MAGSDRTLSRRRFVEGVAGIAGLAGASTATALGAVGLHPDSALGLEPAVHHPDPHHPNPLHPNPLHPDPLHPNPHQPDLRHPHSRANRRQPSPFHPPLDPYDDLAHLGTNENPYGPSTKAREAMESAWKYANRYGYPDADIRAEIAAHHSVEPENVLMGAGSGETLKVVGLTYLQPGKKVIGVDPSYGFVYSHAAGINADAIRLPLKDDYRQDIPAMIRAIKRNYREIGFVYLCNPNNPTGRTVSSDEVRLLLDSIPEDLPVLIDEAYHHFVTDPEYATAVPYVNAGRNVIVARTFSKIYGMAGLRLGYGIAPAHIIQQMRPWGTGSINALVKWGAAAALKDKEAELWVRDTTIRLRNETMAELNDWGYETIPSETNFFMVYTGRPVQEVRAQFRERGVAVGRPFPPLTRHLRVSIGTEEEMDRFKSSFREIFGV